MAVIIYDTQGLYEYLNHVGAVPIARRFPGWIPEWQRRASVLFGAITAAGGPMPFGVHYRRHGCFLVTPAGGAPRAVPNPYA